MMVLVLRKAKPGLKGHVTRWLSEVGVGVYLGTVSVRVRDRLWARVATEIGDGGAVMIYPAQTEQGYAVVTTGDLPYTFEDFDGLVLAKRRISVQ
jgi:CRISPR-associated protein Cas2